MDSLKIPQVRFVILGAKQIANYLNEQNFILYVFSLILQPSQGCVCVLRLIADNYEPDAQANHENPRPNARMGEVGFITESCELPLRHGNIVRRPENYAGKPSYSLFPDISIYIALGLAQGQPC
jgi:hypothetical protein